MSSQSKYYCKCPTLKKRGQGACNLEYTYEGHLIRHIRSKHPQSFTGFRSAWTDDDIRRELVGVTNEVALSPAESTAEEQQPAKKQKTGPNVGPNVGAIYEEPIQTILNELKSVKEDYKNLEARLHAFEIKEKRLCVACWENESNHALIPCGHKILCGTCAATMYNARSPCPLCRERCDDILQIWDAGVTENVI